MEKLQNIQVLRILACLGVFCVHIGQRLEISEEPIAKIAAFGANGVYLFFLISGAMAFLSLSKRNHKQINYIKYWIGRAIKILPVYYSIILYNYVLHVFILEDVPIDPSSLGWMRYFLCINRIFLTGVNFWDNLSATWTISSFLCFYLFAPILYRVITSSKHALGFLIIGYVLNKILPLPEPIRMMPFFACGILVYFVIKEGKEHLFITGALCVVLLYGIIFETWTTIVYTLIFGTIIISTKDMKTNNIFLKKVINVFDEYSYVIYLVHAVVIEWFDITKSIYRFWQHKGISFLIILLCTAIGVYVLHNVIELPIQNFLEKRIHNKSNI